MRRTIPILSGLAIIVVILNHSAWHVLKNIAPGPDTLVGALPFLVFDQLTKFAVPAFVFIAGYFIAYATSEGRQDLKWSVVQARLEGLAWPWVAWSLLLTGLQSIEGRPVTFGQFLYNLFVQYYFIPLLLMYYLFSMLVVRWVKRSPRATLIGAGALQLAAMTVWYARVYLPGFPPELYTAVDIGPAQWLRFAFFFPLGVLTGMHSGTVRAWLVPVKRVLPWLTLALLTLSTMETMNAYRMGRVFYPIGGDHTKLTSVLFSLALLLTFAAYERINLPLSQGISYLGKNTFGYYLSHYAVLGVLAKGFYYLLPWVSTHGWVLLPILFVLVVAICSLMMESAKRLPVRKFYRYVFG